MSGSRSRTIISITRQSALLVAAIALAGSAACSNPTPDAFNQPITPKSGSGDSADTTGNGDPAAGDTSGDGTGTGAGDTSQNSQPKTAGSTSSPKCFAAVASAGTGEHHPGESCGGCHDTMPNAAWTVSGTVFAAAGVGVAGATIEVVDASGKKLSLVTGDNGNFYTTSAVQMPLTVRSSKCPSNSAMTAKVNAGSCNSCHDSTNPIIL